MIKEQREKIDKKQPAYIKDAQLAIQQLGIKLKDNDKQDFKWLTLILGKYLRCGSWTRAKQHCRATSIGQLDLDMTSKTDYQDILKSEANNPRKSVNIHQSFSGNFPNVNRQSLQNQKQKKQETNVSKRCRCCGLLISQEISDLSTKINRIQNLGVCNHLYFQTVLMICFTFIATIVILSFYSLITNIVAAAIYRNYFGDSQLANQDNTFKGVLMTSFGSKRNMDGSYSHITIPIQCWLTLITVGIMGWLLYRLKYQQIYYQRIFYRRCLSPGKFSLFLADVPIHLYGKDKSYFQSVFQQYIQKVIKVMSKQDRLLFFHESGQFNFHQRIQIQSVAHIMPTVLKAYYSQREKTFKQLEQEKMKIRQNWIQIIKYRIKNNFFNKSFKQLQQTAEKADDFWKRKLHDSDDFLENVKQMDSKQERQRFKTLSVIVTFNNVWTKQLIEAFHKRQQSFIYRRFTERQFLMLPNENEQKIEVKVLPAPEPEDIIWENHTVTHPYRILMIILMYLTTGVLLIISFVIVFFLSGQSQIMSRSYEYKQSFWIVSLVINLFLQAFDLLIGFSITTFTKWERHCSQTDVQTSIAAKTIMAVLVNSTLIPACIYGLIKRNIFGVEGLADTIFLQSIIKVATAIFMPLIFYILYLMKICWKRLTCNLLKVKQKQLNKEFEKPEFEIGKNYAQLIGLYYYGCFYFNLQPLVPIIICFGTLALYYSKKVAIYRFQKRPVQGSSQISHTIDNFIYLGPILFAIGNFLWTDSFSSYTSLMIRIPNILIILASLVIFFAPFQQFEGIRSLKKDKLYDRLHYEEQRIFFSTQYARKNPLTEAEAHQQHQEFLRKYFKDLQQKYNITKKEQLMNKQQLQAKRDLEDQLQRLQDQFNKQNIFGYADEEYVQDGQYDENGQPCILVNISNSVPKTLINGFRFVNNLETELERRERFKQIPVYANVGDWEVDIEVTCVNLQYLGLNQKQLNEINQIIQKHIQDQYNDDSQSSDAVLQHKANRLSAKNMNEPNTSQYQRFFQNT